MSNLQNYLLDYYSNKYQFHLDTYNNPGEAEFKILKYLLKNNINQPIIFSPDSDMILLSLLQNNLTILSQDKNKSFIFIDINNLKKAILKPINYLYPNKFNPQDVINDIVILFSFFGDDFIPKIDIIPVNLTLNFILNLYFQHLYSNPLIFTKNNTNWNSFKIFIQSFKPFLHLLDITNQQQKKYHNYNFVIDFNLKALLYNNININNNYNNNYNLSLYFALLKEIDLIEFNQNYSLKNNLPFQFYHLKMDFNQILTFYRSYITTKNNPKYNKTIKPLSFSFKSTDNYHQQKLNSLDPKQQLDYKINYRLDEFYHLFNTNHQIPNTNNDFILDYLIGIDWIRNYYLNLDDTINSFCYLHHHVPTLNHLIDFNYNNININKFKPIPTFTPWEHFIYVSPLYPSNLSILNYLDYPNKKNIKKFIKKLIFVDLNQYLDKLLNHQTQLFCHHTIFINKCDLPFLIQLENQRFKLLFK
jgi:hypothetical protein